MVSPVVRNREADEQGIQRCITVAAPDKAIKSFEMTDPWPFKQNQAVQIRSRRRWNIVPGTGAAGTIYAESHIRRCCIFSESESEPLNFFQFRNYAMDGETGSEPGHFARDQSRSRQDILLRAGSPGAVDTSPDPRAGV